MTGRSRPVRSGAGEAEVSVVLPVHRTRAFLPELYRRLCDVIDGMGVRGELIFIDDACPEDSWADLAEFARRDPRVRALRLCTNVGQQRAVLVGLRHARGRIVVVMDADLQDPPEAIPELVARVDGDTAGVFAARAGRYESGGRLFTSRCFKWIVTRLTGAPPNAGLFVALSRPLVRHLTRTAPARPHLVPLISTAGFPLAAAPVVRDVRPSGVSAYSSWRRLRTGVGAIWLLLRIQIGHPPPVGSPDRVDESVERFTHCPLSEEALA